MEQTAASAALELRQLCCCHKLAACLLVMLSHCWPWGSVLGHWVQLSLNYLASVKLYGTWQLCAACEC